MYEEEGAETWRPLNIQMKSEERESHFPLAQLTAPTMHWADDTLIFMCKDQSPVLFAPSFRDVFSTFHHRDDLIADFPSCLVLIGNQPPHVLLTAERLHLFHGWMFPLYRLYYLSEQRPLNLQISDCDQNMPVKSHDFWMEFGVKSCSCCISGRFQVRSPPPTLHFISEYTTLKKWVSWALW